jgi:hypothetical protein
MEQRRTTWRRTVVTLAALLLTLAASRVAAADTITVAWDPSPDSSVAGYIVYVGTQPGTYSQNFNVGPALSYSFTTAVPGQLYCFAVSAYADGPVEGPRSEEVCGYSNQRPTLTNPGPQTSIVGQPDSLQLTGSDPDGQALTASATGLPPGLTLGASTGFISGTPTTAGNYSVTVTLSDGVLTTSQTFSWSVAASGDVTAPTIAITSPTSSATYTTGTSSVILGGTAGDTVGVTQVTWSNNRGGSGTATGTTNWSVSSITLQSGSNTLTVTARDAAGNTATDVLTVTYNAPDTTAPAVTITLPTAASTFAANTGSLNVSGTATDAVGVTQVTWSNDRGGSGTAAGTTTWSVNGVALLGGVNVITITARDAAGNTATDTLSVTFTPPVLTLTGLTANKTAPQPTGTAITFTATATNGIAPYQYKWWLFDGSAWTVLQTWTSSNTFTWTPSTASSSFRIGVWIRNAGATADAYDNASSNGSIAFPITTAGAPPSPLAVTSLTANRTSPQLVGTPITFTASISGGTAAQQYKWLLSDGSATSVVQGWSTNNTWTWTPSATNGAYQITVWARSSWSTTDAAENAESTRSIPFAITTAPQTPLVLTAITANMGAPQPVGTPVTFTASVSGGTAPHQYKWWVFDGSSWNAMQTWSTSNVWTWTPTSSNAFTRVGVWVRNAGSTADAYDNAASNGSIAFPISGAQQPAAPLPLAVTLTANRTSPQVVGTPVTFTANPSGGTAPQQYKWLLFDGSTTSVVQTWSTSNSWTWTPTTANAAYQITVWARSASNTADAPENANSTRSLPFAITTAPQTPVVLTGLTANMPAPQPAGTSITFIATATGGTTPYQYKWWVYDGSSWQVLQSWTSSSSMTWTPTTASNAYRIAVWIRNASSTADAYDNANANGSVPFPVSGSSTPQPPPQPGLMLTGLTPNLAAPQPVGTPVTFTATATGGSAPYQYKWWVYNGSAWTVLQTWTSSNTFTWTPTIANSAYRIAVWVRNAGSTADAYDNGANVSVPFSITPSAPAPPLLLTGIIADRVSPQPVGASITFTASATGGSGVYQYKWWIYNGVSWTVVQTWSSSNAFTWRPGTPNANYRVAVWVRNASSTTDAYDNPSSNGSIGFVIK